MKPIQLRYKFCPVCGKRLITKYTEGKDRLVCVECGFIFYQNPIPSVGMIVIKEGSCLFIKRGKAPGQNTWAPPSGFVECGETLEEAAARELKEETGLIGHTAELLGAYSETNEVYGDIITVVYLMKVTGGELTAGDDALDARFYHLDDLPRIHFACFKKALKEYKKRHLKVKKN